MEYSFLFPLMQKLLKSIKKCESYGRKAIGLFFPGHGVYCIAPSSPKIQESLDGGTSQLSSQKDMEK